MQNKIINKKKERKEEKKSSKFEVEWKVFYLITIHWTKVFRKKLGIITKNNNYKKPKFLINPSFLMRREKLPKNYEKTLKTGFRLNRAFLWILGH